jgi:Cyclic phosphodiesterase-like protein
VPQHMSYWLVPAAAERSFWQQLIDTLGRTYNAPAFVPHVTIYSGASAPQDNPLEIMTQATRDLHGIRLQVDRILYTEAFTKSLFVQFHPSAQLSGVTEALRRLSAQPSAYVLDPHLSLLYKHLPAHEKHQLAATIELPTPEIFFDAVWANASSGVTRTAEDVRRWQVVERHRLPAAP